MKNQVFVIRVCGTEVWQALANGKIVKADFQSRGAALAALVVEEERQKKLPKSTKIFQNCST